jgi:O-antigen/teichoic acid export membrane protein
MLSPFNAEVGFAVYSRFKEYPSKIAEGVQWNLMLVGHLVLPAGLLVFLFSESILQTVLGAQWVPAAPLLQGFSLFLITLPVYVVLKYVLLARGNVRDVTLTRSISAVFVLAWIGIAYFREGFWQYLPWIISTVILASTVFLAWRCSKIGISIPWLSIFGIPSVLVSLLLVLGIYLRSNGMNALLIMVLFLSLWLVALVLFEHKKMFEIYGRLKA